MVSNYSSKRHRTSDRILNSCGYRLYKKLYGEDVTVETAEKSDDFEGIDRFIKKDGKEIDTISDRFRPYKSECGMDLRNLDAVTIRASGIDGKLLEINHMKANKFVYAIENKECNDTARWHFFDVQGLVPLIKNKKIHTIVLAREGQNKFHVVACKDIRNNGLMISEGKTISDANLLISKEDIIDWNI